MADGEILVLPFFGQGHLFPCIELTKHLSSRNFSTTLIISSALSSSIPASLRQHHPLIHIAEIDSDSPPPPPPPETSEEDPSRQPPDLFQRQPHDPMAVGLESLLSSRDNELDRPVCAIVDIMMSWSKDVFAKFQVPVVAFFTSGACSAAIEYGSWKDKDKVDDLKPGEIRVLPGLPEDMALSYSDLKRPARGRGPGSHPGGRLGGRGFSRGGRPPGGGGGRMRPFGAGFKGPPGPGQRPMWADEAEGAFAIMMNTCHELEGPFLDYVADQMGRPVWGVGPLLPEEYWKSAGSSSLVRDTEIRPKKQSSHAEDDVSRWLDSKPRGSVLYVSFGSEVGPSREEYAELAKALEESDRPFIWVIQLHSGRPGPPGVSDEDGVGYYPHGLDSKVGERGLIIRGWAPQLLILSHPSTGGFLSHCGWNSTVEAIGKGVPLLAWPIRGDQFYNAKLVVSHLKTGCMVHGGGEDLSEMVKSEDVAKGIEKSMGDDGIRHRAAELKVKFESGFPSTSESALDAFRHFLHVPPKKMRYS
ncbi:hypothetical protein Dimus_016701 [Dionaea muscipula]